MPREQSPGKPTTRRYSEGEKEEQPIVWRGPMQHKALQQFVTDTLWGTLDVLFVDLPPGTGDATLSVLEFLPDTTLIAVTTPQTTARVVAARVARMAAETGVPLAGVVENMSAAVCGHCGEQTALFGSGGGELLAQETEAPLLGQVPLDAPLREAGDHGVPVVVAAPGSASARELTRIAATLPAPRRSLAGRALPLSVVPAPAALTGTGRAVLNADRAHAAWVLGCRNAGWTPGTDTEQVPITVACGRTTADPVRARWSVPAHELAAMDGIAVSAVDTAGATPAVPVRLRPVRSTSSIPAIRSRPVGTP